MTVTEYMAWTDSILRYVGGLLTHPAGTPEWEIGRQFALLGDEFRLRYVQDLLLDRAEGTRQYEIAVDLRLLILNWPESRAVA